MNLTNTETEMVGEDTDQGERTLPPFEK